MLSSGLLFRKRQVISFDSPPLSIHTSSPLLHSTTTHQEQQRPCLFAHTAAAKRPTTRLPTPTLPALSTLRAPSSTRVSRAGHAAQSESSPLISSSPSPAALSVATPTSPAKSLPPHHHQTRRSRSLKQSQQALHLSLSRR